jgi:hypothetical protein
MLRRAVAAREHGIEEEPANGEKRAFLRAKCAHLRDFQADLAKNRRIPPTFCTDGER